MSASKALLDTNTNSLTELFNAAVLGGQQNADDLESPFEEQGQFAIGLTQASELLQQWYRPSLREIARVLSLILRNPASERSSSSQPNKDESSTDLAFQNLYTYMTTFKEISIPQYTLDKLNVAEGGIESDITIPQIELHLDPQQASALREHFNQLDTNVVRSLPADQLIETVIGAYSAPSQLIGEILELLPTECLERDRVTLSDLHQACSTAVKLLPDAFAHLPL